MLAPTIGAVMDLDLANGWPSAFTLLLNGPNPASVPFDGGTILVQTAGTTQLTLDPAGGFHLPLPLPWIPQLEGLSLFWQAWVLGDPGATGSWSASNGLETRFGF